MDVRRRVAGGLADDAREHAYDALGLAAVAISRALAKVIAMPAQVRERIYRLWQEAKQRGKVRREAKQMAEPVRRVLEQAKGAVMKVDDLSRLSGMMVPMVIEALKVISAARGPQAAAARDCMVASGLRKPEPPRIQTKQQRARRSDAGKRGWRRRGGR